VIEGQTGDVGMTGQASKAAVDYPCYGEIRKKAGLRKKDPSKERGCAAKDARCRLVKCVRKRECGGERRC
jgi:hypothetical protein